MPDTEKLHWLDKMRAGAFEEAWEYSDKALKSGINRDHVNIPRHFQSIWDGSSLNNKRVLIRCYHGLGDTIMFIRYIPLVKKIAREVTVWIQPGLIELLQTVEGIDHIIPLTDGAPEADYDVDLEIMELAYIFRTTLETIPARMPYLHVGPSNVKPMHGFAAGLVWQAGGWDNSRSVPYELLKPLFGLKNLGIYILQDKAQEAGWHDGDGIHPGMCTLFEHARIIAGLDLMITVDSMPAHLAGALNVPVWLLLQADSDWRWMENRSDSPWYPSMRLFRQRKTGQWGEVINEVTHELKNLTQKAF